ncbi:MAG: L,D-transpeptidase family protein, partial [Bosea sp. (in: a-proteobacteria)]
MRLLPIAITLSISLGLAACEESRYRGAARHNIPIPNEVMALMSEKGMNRANPVLIRSFKKESELEIWKMASDGQYKLLKSYPMCRWSGQLGPKKREGDRQAPEGFYHITPAHMNPNSAFYLSFNMGYPNNFDRAHGRTGAHLMVHGACSSSGCYSMSDDLIAEIYAIVREAHNGGQQAVQMQALPFRMTAENLARHRYDQHMPFWRNLKEGTDMFEVARVAPKVSVCQARYAFNRTENCTEDPTSSNLVAAAAEKRRNDDAQVAALVAKGTPAVRLVYQDGGQHQKFTQILMASGPDGLEQKAAWGSRSVGVSRPDAVLAGPQEIAAAPAGRPAATAIAATPRAIAPAVAVAPAATQPSLGPVAATTRPASAVAGASTSVARTAPSQPAASQPATAAATPEQPSVLQRVMSFNPFAASAPAVTETPAASQSEAKPAQTRAQQSTRTAP